MALEEMGTMSGVAASGDIGMKSDDRRGPGGDKVPDRSFIYTRAGI